MLELKRITAVFNLIFALFWQKKTHTFRIKKNKFDQRFGFFLNFYHGPCGSKSHGYYKQGKYCLNKKRNFDATFKVGP